ncbi:hypothetical protein BKA61DRAFT_663374 [Leptodontidium sp. MPI-SDFR-AT-0119]|nr:hypothetical protein BKA61DRAFT_663374 [Leptodontidium sp. MPI-SDFR-AT-0119]
MRSASEESAAQIITLDLDGGGESEENVSDLERDMQLAFEEQEELLATSPGSPGHRSFESSQPPIDQNCDRSWSEELRSSTRLCSQEKDMEGPREQEQEEIAADEIRHEVLEQDLEQDLEEADDDDESEKLEQRGEKRQYQDGGIKTGIHHSESSGHGHGTNDDDDEEDENPRPTKQQRLFLASPDMPPTPPLEQSSPKPCLARARSATPSSTTHLEIGNVQSQTDLAHPPTSVNNDHHYTHQALAVPQIRRSRLMSRSIFGVAAITWPEDARSTTSSGALGACHLLVFWRWAFGVAVSWSGTSSFCSLGLVLRLLRLEPAI